MCLTTENNSRCPERPDFAKRATHQQSIPIWPKERRRTPSRGQVWDLAILSPAASPSAASRSVAACLYRIALRRYAPAHVGSFKNTPKPLVWCHAHGSIRIQEGQPATRTECSPPPAASNFSRPFRQLASGGVSLCAHFLAPFAGIGAFPALSLRASFWHLRNST
jgi:hypothetical protein